MERKRQIEKPPEHLEFTKLRRQIRAGIREGQEPPVSGLERLLELDDWLAINTNYWKRNYPEVEHGGDEHDRS